MMEITEDQIKEVLVKNAYQWMKYDTQDMATIYVDDFVKELQAKLKNHGVIGDVVVPKGTFYCECAEPFELRMIPNGTPYCEECGKNIKQ